MDSPQGGKYFCVAAEAGRVTGGLLLSRMFVMLAGPFVPSLSKHEWPSKQCPAFALRQAQDERNEARTCGDTILEGRPPPPQLLRRYARISHHFRPPRCFGVDEGGELFRSRGSGIDAQQLDSPLQLGQAQCFRHV